MRTLTRTEARRLAILGQRLAGERPADVVAAVTDLGRVQVDPTVLVARAELLTLWSRLGSYDVADVRRHLEQTRQLFEYVAHLLPSADLRVHRALMRGYPGSRYTRERYVRQWLEANAEFRGYILSELRSRGPLASRALEDRAAVPWSTGGWNDGKNLSRMLEILWTSGQIAISRREGAERVWDLAERVYGVETDAPPADDDVSRRLVTRELRALGVARTDQMRHASGGAGAPGRAAIAQLVRAGSVVPVAIEGLRGTWHAWADLLEALPSHAAWRPRTTLLGPFDSLIAHRVRTEMLFGFRYAFELYVPPTKRQYGPYALTILHDDRLVGRLDAGMDRTAERLVVRAAWAEPDAPADAWPATVAALESLGAWLGATEVTLPPRGVLPDVWR